MTSRSHRARRRRRNNARSKGPEIRTSRVVVIFDRGRLLDPSNPNLLAPGTQPTEVRCKPVPFILTGPVTITPLDGEPFQVEHPKGLTRAWRFPDGSLSFHLRTVKR